MLNCSNNSIPKFLLMLYNILEEQTLHSSPIIKWMEHGKAFQIISMDAFELDILPKYFKHSKFTSFQRQLNYFGFRKWTKTQTTICTFSHPNFQQNKKENLKYIVKKQSISKNTNTVITKRKGDKLTTPTEKNNNVLKKQKTNEIRQQNQSNLTNNSIVDNNKELFHHLQFWECLDKTYIEMELINFDVDMMSDFFVDDIKGELIKVEEQPSVEIIKTSNNFCKEKEDTLNLFDCIYLDDFENIDCINFIN